MSLSGYRLAPGWITRDELLANSAYAIENFPRQSDMEPGRDWIRPGEEADRAVNGTVADSLDGHRGVFGDTDFVWPIQAPTPLMVKYMVDTFLGGGYSGLVTHQSFNRHTGAWETYWAIAVRPEDKSLELAARGFHPWPLTLLGKETADAGPDLALNFDVSPNSGVQGNDFDVTVSVFNDGDAATYDDVVVIIHLDDADWEFQGDAAGTNWTFDYSTDGVTYGALPGDPTTVFYIRATRSAVLDAAGTTPNITFSAQPSSVGFFNVEASVSLMGVTHDTADELIEATAPPSIVMSLFLEVDTPVVVTNNPYVLWTATNNSAIATTEPTVVIIHVDSTNLEFNGDEGDGGGWTWEFGTDGVNWSGSYGDPTTIKWFRATYSASLDPSETTPYAQFTCEAVGAGGTNPVDGELYNDGDLKDSDSQNIVIN